MVEIPACEPAGTKKLIRMELCARPHDRSVKVGHLAADRLAKIQLAPLKRKKADCLSLLADNSDFNILAHRGHGPRELRAKIRAFINASRRLNVKPQRPIGVCKIGNSLQFERCHGEAI